MSCCGKQDETRRARELDYPPPKAAETSWLVLNQWQVMCFAGQREQWREVRQTPNCSKHVAIKFSTSMQRRVGNRILCKRRLGVVGALAALHPDLPLGLGCRTPGTYSRFSPNRGLRKARVVSYGQGAGE